ncbi:bifunctional UDP-N-acetylglucosamine diphosphorylase/glucosamine-1-phosphate N-acetyltransferase GlmU [Corynebacterium lujinxingii]|uniref:Bifunctional protein GlmU n=1 Tax=Corynebacterium lujinxingii TaxID=2763010 RepID=A0A7H0K0N1_9CORY|nr:bifunctional UDP-N-acetylglucosamine diphosphorylase/glucosamine-1-phosphate N-acetyltransferase GlmU [Corynebacterium lujinxingii]MBC3179409.1 bifunctional UDP-N-acetylglucosamine diphosphorylase/glucosamine-1-phosphate N-acetyltransferase GlmU [Corynebacterium lujinxingii]NNO11514.1 bifunctional UDP-N-acetylglucosamine diphosphorylase/glucosamine-1-phosphate N-acetyltransferase GlmU [Corynebacterium lujinxingii]QNP90847.1 bifunctional UDP-N-acetylglucosamine diphosphorylase/glucosamine-1-ph
MPNHSERAVVVLAAGAGTRMKSDRQKTLHEIGGRSLLSHSLHAAAGVAPTHLVAVVGHQRDQVSPAVEQIAEQMHVEIRQAIQEEQNGTGHAVQVGLSAIPDFDGTVVVTNGDVPLLTPETLQALVDKHESEHAAVTVLSLEFDNPTGYGRIIRGEAGDVLEIVEEKDATDEQRRVREVNSGVFAFDGAVLRDALARVTPDNAQGEFYITDVLGIARGDGRKVAAFVAPDARELAGVNDRVQLAEAGKELNRRLVERAMRAGATVIDPATTWIGVEVEIGRDVVIHPNTQLWGSTVIGDGAEIGPETTLTDMEVGARAKVVRTQGELGVIGEEATVGPFTYIRPGTELGARGKLGGFVEAKNAKIGEGSKVPHLTYIGDATVGKHSNIGASSVFANYDGVQKHHTTIGDYCRTGSDTMFVAPVNIGDGAYTGAGTVVTEDVPAGALAIKEGRQRNIEGWVEDRRPGTEAAEAAKNAKQEG